METNRSEKENSKAFWLDGLALISWCIVSTAAISYGLLATVATGYIAIYALTQLNLFQRTK